MSTSSASTALSPSVSPPPPPPASSEPPSSTEEEDSLARSTKRMKESSEAPPSDVTAAAAPRSFRDSLVQGLHNKEKAIVTRDELDAVEARALQQISDSFMSADIPEVVVSTVPQLWIDDEIHEKLCKPWRNSVIIKLLGKSISFFTLRARLARDWKTEYEYEIIDVGLGYYVVKFQSFPDSMAVLTGGPYKIFDHYLAVQPWEPNFQPAKARMPKTAIWVHFEGVPMEYYQDEVLMKLGDKVGKSLKVDRTALIGSRGQFARVCVEFDLSQPLPASVEFKFLNKPTSSTVKCVYEGLHTICFTCGQFGHKSEFCRHTTPPPAPLATAPPVTAVKPPPSPAEDWEKETSHLGPWNIAKKKQRKGNPAGFQHKSDPNGYRKDTGKLKSGKFPESQGQTQISPPTATTHNSGKSNPDNSSNRFNALMDEDTIEQIPEVAMTDPSNSDSAISVENSAPNPDPKISDAQIPSSSLATSAKKEKAKNKAQVLGLINKSLKGPYHKQNSPRPTFTPMQVDIVPNSTPQPVDCSLQTHSVSLPAQSTPIQTTPPIQPTQVHEDTLTNHTNNHDNSTHTSILNSIGDMPLPTYPIDPGDQRHNLPTSLVDDLQNKKLRMRQQLEIYLAQQLREGNMDNVQRLRDKIKSAETTPGA